MLELSHKNMIIWKKSLKLVKEVYRITSKFPGEEKFGLISQLRRASVSVTSNISEGEARRTNKEKRRYYEIACASVVEIDAQIEICLELNFVSEEEVQKLSIKRKFCNAFKVEKSSIGLFFSLLALPSYFAFTIA